MKNFATLLVASLILVQPGSAQQSANPADIPLEAFAQLPNMRGSMLSPDGAYLAYLRTMRGRGHLVIRELFKEDGHAAIIPPAKTTDFDWLRWANNDRLVYGVSATRKRGRVETVETRLLAVDKDGSNWNNIIRPTRGRRSPFNLPSAYEPAQIQDDVVHWLSDEPNHILVSMDGDHNSAAEIRRVNINNGNFTIAQPDHKGIQNWLTDHDGVPRLGWGFRNNKLKVMSRTGDVGWKTDTDAFWHDAGYFPQGFSDVPDVAYMLGPDRNGFEVIRTMNVVTNEFLENVMSREGVDVGGLIYDPYTLRPVGVHITEHQREYHYFDKTLAAIQTEIDEVLPDTVNYIASTSEHRRKVLVLSSSDVDAGVYTLLDRDKGTLDFVGKLMPGLAPELMSPVEPVSYAARDGLTIPAYLIVPKDIEAANLKTIILPHGGPAARDDQSFWFLSQFLASRGYAVFQPNFRGSTGYGRVFEHAGRNEWGGKMQEDVTDGVQWLIDEGIADPDNICIVGWSYGGYSAAMGAVQTPDLYQCAASINGVLNLPKQIADDKKYIGGSVWSRHVGAGNEHPKTVSPYHQAEHIRIPMLIIQAKDDARVHLDQGKTMARRLKRQKKAVTYVEVDLGGHSMTNSAARMEILAALDAFLATNLGRN